MNKQLFFICIATVNLYSGVQAAAMDLSLLGAKVQPKIVKLQEELNALSIEELQAKLDENAAKAKRRSLSQEERLALHLRNCEISQDILDTLGTFDQEEIEQFNAEFADNIAKLNIHSIKSSERSDIALANMVIIDRLTTLGAQIHEE